MKPLKVIDFLRILGLPQVATTPKRKLFASLFALELSVKHFEGEDVIARNVRSSLLEMAPPIVCCCIQDSEPIEISEALGAQ